MGIQSAIPRPLEYFFGVIFADMKARAGICEKNLRQNPNLCALFSKRPESNSGKKAVNTFMKWTAFNETILSPLIIEGKARGYWFFEASFPVVLTNWDGLIIAQHYAEAQDEWMTEEFVPFRAVLEFESPVFPGVDENHFSRRGYLVLKKDNPSGLPEHDDALEIPVLFK